MLKKYCELCIFADTCLFLCCSVLTSWIVLKRVWVLVFIFNKVWKFFSVMLNLVHYSKRHCNSCFVFLFIPIKIYYTFVTPRTIAHQAPLSMVFSRQEYWSGLPFPSPGDLPDPGIECESPVSSVLQVDYLPLTYQGSPKKKWVFWVLVVFILSKIGKFFFCYVKPGVLLQEAL